MDSLLIFMSGMAIIAVCLVLWSNTKSGKRWIENL